jgi:enoyl-CoA hydratase
VQIAASFSRGDNLWNDLAMSGEEVRYERTGTAVVLTIDRPHRRNAVDGATAARLRRGLEEFEADEAARVLVLTCAGG